MLTLCILSSAQFAQRFQSLSCLPCAFCFVPAYTKYAHEFLTLFHRHLSLAFLADFTLSDSTDLIRFIAFSYTLLFVWIERHDHMSSVLQAQQLYSAGIPLLEAYLLPMANNRTRKERLPRTKSPLATWPRFMRMRVFRGVKKWLTYHVAVPTLASQRSIFRENRLKISTFIRR